MNNGLLIAGRYHPVPGLNVISPGPGAPKFVRLSPRDYRMRETTWVRQLILHSTKGIHPQIVLPGRGPGGSGRTVAEYWYGDDNQSAAPIIIDTDGTVYVLCDLATVCAYHAGLSNDWSVGIELYQLANGGIYEATFAAWAILAPALCRLFRIPFQIHSAPYRNTIVARMKLGGDDCVGIFGHRDQAWKFPWQLTLEQRLKHPAGHANRGRGDPGDEGYARAIAAGAEPLDYDLREDIVVWKRRQTKIGEIRRLIHGTPIGGSPLLVDGIAGHATMDALYSLGFKSGRELDAAVELPR